MTHKRKDFFVDGNMLMMTVIICYVVSLFYRVVVVGLLNASMTWQYDIIYNVYNVLYIIVSYGISIVISRLIKELCKQKKYKDVEKLFFSSIIFFGLVILMEVSIVYFCGGIIENKILDLYECSGIIKRMLIPLSVMTINGVLRGYFQGNNASFISYFSLFLESLTGVLSASILALKYKYENKSGDYISKAGVKGIAIGTIIGLVFLVSIYLINRPIIKKRVLKTENDLENIKENFIKKIIQQVEECKIWIEKILISEKYFLLTIIIWEFMYLIDKILFNKFLNNSIMKKKTLLGLNVKVILLLNFFVLIAVVIGNTAITYIKREIIRKNYAKIRKMLNLAIRYNIVIIIYISFTLIVISKKLVNLLSKDDMTNVFVSKILVLGAIGIIFYTLAVTASKILIEMNNSKMLLKNVIIAFELNILVEVLLIMSDKKSYALIISYIIFAFVLCLLNYYVVIKQLRYKIEYIKVLIIPITSGFVMSLITSLIMNLAYAFVKMNSVSIIIGCTSGIFIYFVSIVILGGVSEEELLKIPKGKTLLKLSKKMHLI